MTDKCKETRDNYWLAADKTISPEQLEYYNEHMKSCAECRKYAAENDELAGEFSALPLYDVDEEVYLNMITKLPPKRRWFPTLRKKESTSNINYIRYAFTGIVVIATIALMILFNSENKLKEIRKPVISFDWRAEKIENNFQRIDSSLTDFGTKSAVRRTFQEDPWRSDAYLLAKDIERMQSELNKSTL